MVDAVPSVPSAWTLANAVTVLRIALVPFFAWALLVDGGHTTTGRLVAGSGTPVEVTEVWTFARRRGADWELSAIQQTS